MVSLVRRSSLANDPKEFRRTPPMPTELLDRIVGLALSSRSPVVVGLAKTDFSCIASFSLASSRFRRIALRRYFSDLQLWSSSHWAQLWRLLRAQGKEAFAWVKVLQARAEILALAPTRLDSLPNLQALFIDFSLAGVATQKSLTKEIFSHISLQPFRPTLPSRANPLTRRSSLDCGPVRLTSLTLTALPYINKALLAQIANNLPTLTCLYLSCTDRLDLTCCWTCFRDSATCSIGMFPIPDMFSHVDLLATTFAKALKPLTRLTHLHLGVFLCDEMLFNTHLCHADVFDSDFMEGSIPYAPDECFICLKHASVDAVRERELEASKIMVKRLKSLETIGWSTFFHRANGRPIPGHMHDKIGDWERSTTIFVLRKDGKIRMKGTPWF